MDNSFLKIDGQCQVTISEDEMSAWITLTSPKNGGEPATLEQIKTALSDRGVTYNINELVLDQAALLSQWDTQILIASGKPPEEGRNGYIQYHFPMDDEILRPIETEDGRVDFHHLNLIHNVKQGDLLAEKIPAVDGEDGWTVTGKVVHPAPVKTPVLIGGKDTIVESGTGQLFAAKDGHATCVDGKPSVISVYIVKHDINFATGNIDFVGNVQIYGDVKTGFRVKAGGDIEIFGMVEAAEVNAGGNILIKNGIFGAGHCSICAGGNILAKYVENAVLKAGKDVIVNDSISRSLVKAGGKIKVSSSSGDIVGGHLEALDEISAGIFGSQLSIPTLLELGVEPAFRGEYSDLIEKYREKKKIMQTLESQIIEYKNFRENKKEVSQTYQHTTRDRLRQYAALRNELGPIEAKIYEFESELTRLNRGIVKANKMVYPGVIISIVKTTFLVEEEMKRVMFIYNKGVVEPVPLRG